MSEDSSGPTRIPVAIVGGGLAGLYAAYSLQEAGIDFHVYEARDRFGGRILSAGRDAYGAQHGFDLGPSWFWPDLHPEMGRVISQLGLQAFPQHDEGDVLVERQPNAPPVRFAGYRQNPRSMRIVGGTGALIERLVHALPQHSLSLNSRVVEMAIEGRCATLALRKRGGTKAQVVADQVIMALPPRLLEASIAFTPPVKRGTRLRWRETDTWMAPHAKFVALYDRPFWREEGLSGMAQSMVGPLAEIHDATTSSGAAALFGFFGLGPDERDALGTDTLRRACLNQLARLFGQAAGLPRDSLLMDWTTESLTATALDRQGKAHPLPQHGPWISGPWQELVALAGSETSAIAPGYLAGAIEAGQRSVAETIKKLEARRHRA